MFYINRKNMTTKTLKNAKKHVIKFLAKIPQIQKP